MAFRDLKRRKVGEDIEDAEEIQYHSAPKKMLTGKQSPQSSIPSESQDKGQTGSDGVLWLTREKSPESPYDEYYDDYEYDYDYNALVENVWEKSAKSPYDEYYDDYEYDYDYNDLVDDVLEDLAAKFIHPLPQNIKEDPVMLCFFIEEAFWHFIKNYLCEDSYVKERTLNEFASEMFCHIDFLRDHVNIVDSVIEEWQYYKSIIPTFGGILLNSTLDKVILVKSAKGFWGFPKGKINELEEPEECAAREVMEEVGIDITSYINKKEFVEKHESNHSSRLYIVPGVRESTELKPSCPYEIMAIKWFDLEVIPSHLQDESRRSERDGVSSRKFFHVIPFMREILEWVKEQKDWELSLISQRERKMASLGLPIQFVGGLQRPNRNLY